MDLNFFFFILSRRQTNKTLVNNFTSEMRNEFTSVNTQRTHSLRNTHKFIHTKARANQYVVYIMCIWLVLFSLWIYFFRLRCLTTDSWSGRLSQKYKNNNKFKLISSLCLHSFCEYLQSIFWYKIHSHDFFYYLVENTERILSLFRLLCWSALLESEFLLEYSFYCWYETIKIVYSLHNNRLSVWLTQWRLFVAFYLFWCT